MSVTKIALMGQVANIQSERDALKAEVERMREDLEFFSDQLSTIEHNQNEREIEAIRDAHGIKRLWEKPKHRRNVTRQALQGGE